MHETTSRSARFRLRTMLVAGFLLAAGQASTAQASAEDLAALLDHPTARRFEASAVTLADGSSWIKTDVEVEAVYLGRLEDLLAILKANENFPKIFSRVEFVRLLSRDGATTVSEQRNVVRLLGFSYSTDLIFRSVVSVPGPGRALIASTMIDGDGSSKSVDSSWALEEVSLDGKAAVLVRYSCVMLVLSKFPMQLQIMQAFGKSDYERLVGELGKAFAARSAPPKAESASAPAQPHS